MHFFLDGVQYWGISDISSFIGAVIGGSGVNILSRSSECLSVLDGYILPLKASRAFFHQKVTQRFSKNICSIWYSTSLHFLVLLWTYVIPHQHPVVLDFDLNFFLIILLVGSNYWFSMKLLFLQFLLVCWWLNYLIGFVRIYPQVVLILSYYQDTTTASLELNFNPALQ